MRRCVGGCKGPKTRSFGQQWLMTDRGLYVVLHDVEECPQGAAAVIEQKRDVLVY